MTSSRRSLNFLGRIGVQHTKPRRAPAEARDKSLSRGCCAVYRPAWTRDTVKPAGFSYGDHSKNAICGAGAREIIGTNVSTVTAKRNFNYINSHAQIFHLAHG